jgi:2-oxoglutarate ferredoxin oxidoreductase subunit delta
LVPGRVVINEARCKGCELCVQFCPRKIIVMRDTRNARGYRPAAVVEMDKCTACGTCAQMCPDVVIEVFRVPEADRGGRTDNTTGKQG